MQNRISSGSFAFQIMFFIVILEDRNRYPDETEEIEKHRKSSDMQSGSLTSKDIN